MRKENVSTRLKQIMSDRNLRQADIIELCQPYCKQYNVRLGRNDLSQYVSGKVEPGQRKLTVLSLALNVNEAWLMGFDAPMKIEEKWPHVRKYMERTDAFEAELKSIGWDCEFIYCEEWEFYEVGLTEDENGEVIENKYKYSPPSGCKKDGVQIKCEKCPHRYPHYRLSNGTISFDISEEDYRAFYNDVEIFLKERLQKLLLKSAEDAFDIETKAAHVRTDIALTQEAEEHDQAIMDDDSEWK